MALGGGGAGAGAGAPALAPAGSDDETTPTHGVHGDVHAGQPGVPPENDDDDDADVASVGAPDDGANETVPPVVARDAVADDADDACATGAACVVFASASGATPSSVRDDAPERTSPELTPALDSRESSPGNTRRSCVTGVNATSDEPRAYAARPAKRPGEAA